MACLGCTRTDELRAEERRPDLLQGPGDALRIARELHGGGVGQELALTRDSSLDEISEHQSDEAQDHEDEADRQKVKAAVVAARITSAAAGVGGNSEQLAAQQAHEQDSIKDAH